MDREKFADRFIKARRAAIERDFAHLNEMQRHAVMATEGPLLLLAGAGSGKTTVLINRIVNLLKYGSGSDSDYVPGFVSEDDLALLERYAETGDEELRAQTADFCAVDPVEPWRLIAITFTNKAADELKSRLEKALGPRARDVWAMTFHSACVRILRRDIEAIGYGRSFTIYDTSDSQSLMKRIIKELDLDEKSFPYKTVLSHISKAKDKMISPAEFAESAEKSYDLRKKSIALAYLEYEKRLKAANALDFDDLILLTVKLLRECEEVREYYQKKFRYVLIDEYQDTNALQHALAGLLAGGSGNICVVGDDDQSIYRFRGATVENILNFEKRYKKSRVILLEQNYRSTGHILSAANEVIGNNRGRKGKKLWTEHKNGDKLVLHIASNEREEAQFVANAILQGFSEGRGWSDFAVLFRMNAQSNQFEFSFKQHGIPYRMIGGMRFFERAEVKDMLAYLCTVQNPGDDLRLLRILNNPPRGIGQRAVDTLQSIALERNVPLFEVILHADEFEDLKRAAPRLLQFADMIGDLRALSEAVPLDEFYDELIDRTGYIRSLEEKDTDENKNRIENVRELKTNILTFIKEASDGTLPEFLSEMALYTDLDQYDPSAERVTMMTMHSAKGLEFDTVFVAGAEEGIFPSSRSIGDNEELEEERRLCYVAITRAKRRLWITSARQRMLFGKTTTGMLSRFIEEISEENIDKPEKITRVVSYTFDDDFDDRSYGRQKSSYGTGFSGRPRESVSFADYSDAGRLSPPKESRRDFTRQPAPHTSPPPYEAGDAVVHKAFGRGKITSVQKAGNDALLEVEFENSGTKRLMLKAAMAYMSKGE